eukprot:SAG31_NODE_37350_length_305_cov_0.669903_1_plen_57_part_00
MELWLGSTCPQFGAEQTDDQRPMRDTYGRYDVKKLNLGYSGTIVQELLRYRTTFST